MSARATTNSNSTNAVDTTNTVQRLDVSVFRIPTDRPEADGTFAWDSTTMVLVEATAASGERGLGFSYASAAAATVIHETLAQAICGCAVADVGAAWEKLVRTVRNAGRPGIAATAISAVDVALWDLKARCAGVALCTLLGPVREAVPIYGSGGFTSYTEAELAEQLGGWVGRGIPRVKMKIGTCAGGGRGGDPHLRGIPRVKMKIGTDWGTKPEVDVERVQVARRAIGHEAELFVDANGAYTAKQAIGLARRFAEEGVSYFEEPVSSDQLEQLAFIRGRIPQDVAAGEYGYDPWYFRDMLRAGAVDIMQADATRCLGITGWLEAARLAHSFGVPFSAHCGPAIHAQAGCAAPQLSHVEYFHDHARIEQMLFEGAPEPDGGVLRPDPARPGLGP